MKSRGGISRSPVFMVMLAMFATMASVYVAGRLWQDSGNRVFLVKEIDRRMGQGRSAVTVDDNLKILTCRNQHKKLTQLENNLDEVINKGFVPKHPYSKGNVTRNGKRILAVIGVMTGFDGKKNRDAIRKSWVSKGATLLKLEKEKGIVVRFVIGRSANQGDNLDRAIEDENRMTNDILVLDTHVEAPEGISNKVMLFFGQAADTWDAEFYAKINDNIYLNLDPLTSILTANINKPRVYMGCIKSGQVFSDSNHKWYEPDWWKFGDGKSYFRYAASDMLVLSRVLAQFISINRSNLRTYAHDDVSVGSWMIGLDVDHIHESNFCCSFWTPGALCSTAR